MRASLPPVTRAWSALSPGPTTATHIIEMAVAHQLGTPGLTPEEYAEEAARDIDERKAHGEPYVGPVSAEQSVAPTTTWYFPTAGTTTTGSSSSAW